MNKMQVAQLRSPNHNAQLKARNVLLNWNRFKRNGKMNCSAFWNKEWKEKQEVEPFMEQDLMS
jgi:hypothetical protein